MVFSSLIFLFVFLPLVLLCHALCPARLRNAVLLMFSLAFYAWGEARAIFVMLAIIALNYGFALAIEHSEGKPRVRAVLLAVDLCACFAFLFYFKYFTFALKVLNQAFRAHLPTRNIALPIGISFYVFQSVSYAIDVYRRDCAAQKSPLKLALYVSFFPQLIAGPIVKYHEVEQQLESRTVTLSSFAAGLRRFTYGLAKKTLIANQVASVADAVFAGFTLSSSPSLWLGALAYSMQIYFDFSGYSDMALGLARMFGFRFVENFDYPYVSRSVAEFWRRWHISLGGWFREYVYIPLGGNRRGTARTLLNVATVFLLTGIWHGAAFTFVAWGLWHGFFNIVERVIGLTSEVKSPPVKAARHVYTLLVVLTGWVVFRSATPSSAASYIAKMFGAAPKGSLELYPLAYFASVKDALVLVLAAVLSAPLFPCAKARLAALPLAQTERGHLALHAVQNALCLVLLVLSAASLASGTYNPFIYFRF